MRRNYGNFMGNGKFDEIGTSLAETAVMANGLIPIPRIGEFHSYRRVRHVEGEYGGEYE